jgi:hypothetical protein
MQAARGEIGLDQRAGGRDCELPDGERRFAAFGVVAIRLAPGSTRRGVHLHIEGVCISLLGSTQPGSIARYISRALRGGRGDDGLIQRFGLLVWPGVSGEWAHIDRAPDKVARAAAQKVFDRLDRVDWRAIGARRDPGPDGDEEGLPYLRFDSEGYDRFVEWRSGRCTVEISIRRSRLISRNTASWCRGWR